MSSGHIIALEPKSNDTYLFLHKNMFWYSLEKAFLMSTTNYVFMEKWQKSWHTPFYLDLRHMQKKKKKKNRSKILNHLMYLPIFTRALALHWCLLQYPGMSDLTHNFRALPDSTLFLYKMVNGTRGYYSWFLLNEMFLFIVVFKIWEKFSKHFSFKTLVLLNKLRYHAHF